MTQETRIPVWDWDGIYLGRHLISYRIYLDTDQYAVSPAGPFGDRKWSVYHNDVRLGACTSALDAMTQACRHYYVALGYFPGVKRVTHTWPIEGPSPGIRALERASMEV